MHALAVLVCFARTQAEQSINIQTKVGMQLKIILPVASLVLLSACVAPQGPYSTNNGVVQKAFDSIGELLGGSSTNGKSNNQGGKMVAINAANVMIEGPHPTDPRWQGKLISETSLYHFFDAHPRRSPSDNWPRVAIRIDDYSETLIPPNSGIAVQYIPQMVGSSQPNIARPLECLKFTAVIWRSPKQSEKIENIVHCNTDIKMSEPTISVGGLTAYKSVMSSASASSGQVRTFGPQSPTRLLPVVTDTDARLYSTGQHLFSSIFAQLGYRGPLDGDPRLWFLNLAQKPI